MDWLELTAGIFYRLKVYEDWRDYLVFGGPVAFWFFFFILPILPQRIKRHYDSTLQIHFPSVYWWAKIEKVASLIMGTSLCIMVIMQLTNPGKPDPPYTLEVIYRYWNPGLLFGLIGLAIISMIVLIIAKHVQKKFEEECKYKRVDGSRH